MHDRPTRGFAIWLSLGLSACDGGGAATAGALTGANDAGSQACSGRIGDCADSGSSGVALSWRYFSSEGNPSGPLSTTRRLSYSGGLASADGRGALRDWASVRNGAVYARADAQGTKAISAAYRFDVPTATWSAVTAQTHPTNLTNPNQFGETLYSLVPPEVPRQYESFLDPLAPLLVIHDKSTDTWKDLSHDVPTPDPIRGPSMFSYEAGDRMVFVLQEPFQLANVVDYTTGTSGALLAGVAPPELTEPRYRSAIGIGQDRIAVFAGVSSPVDVTLSNARDIEKGLFVRDGWVFDFASRTYHGLPPVPNDNDIYDVVYASTKLCVFKHFLYVENSNQKSGAYILDLNLGSAPWVKANAPFSVCDASSLSQVTGSPPAVQIFDIEANASARIDLPAEVPAGTRPIPSEDGDTWVIPPIGTFSGGYARVSKRTWTSFPPARLPSIGAAAVYLMVEVTTDHLVLWGEGQSVSEATSGCPGPPGIGCDPAPSWSATVSPVGMMIGLP